MTNDTDADMAALAVYIGDHADEPLSLAHLARRTGLGPTALQRRFTKALGVSPKAYQSAERLKRLKGALREGDSVAGAIFEAGYGSTSRVYEKLDGGLGMTPSAYRSGGAGEIIAYAVRNTALGPLLMAATDRGVCKVAFGESAAALVAELTAEFPKARIAPASPAAQPQLDAWMAALAAHLEEGGPRPDLPLDLRGAAFQMRVWRFLLSVEAGKPISYSELAQGIGSPKAVRAAASACAQNRIAVLVPCHRVLRADGSLGGYRWGLERKRSLLASEGAMAASGSGR